MHEDVLKILARRSIREFTDEPVSDELIRDMLKAAMSAPSVRGTDPWHFIVIRNPYFLTQLGGMLSPAGVLEQARAGIVVCGDMETPHRRQLSYLLQDCSAAVENLLLVASMMGLGGCRLCIHPRPARVEEARRILQSRIRTARVPTAPPQGLFLWRVWYPPERRPAGRSARREAGHA